MKSSSSAATNKRVVEDNNALLLPRIPPVQRAVTPNSTESAQELLSVLKTTKSPIIPTTTSSTGLEALLGVLKDGSNWEHLLAVGIDLETFGLPLDQPEPLVLSAKSPFTSLSTSSQQQLRRSSSSSDSTSSVSNRTDDLSNLLPPCYNISNLPPASSKIGSFAEETLFYIFYSMPRDRLQELAARELTVNRNWRFWTTQRIWLTCSTTATIQGDVYVADSFWDVSTWSRTKKDIRIPLQEIEDRFLTSKSS